MFAFVKEVTEVHISTQSARIWSFKARGRRAHIEKSIEHKIMVNIHFILSDKIPFNNRVVQVLHSRNKQDF